MRTPKAILSVVLSFGLLLAFAYAIIDTRGQTSDVRLYFALAGAVGYIGFIAYRWLRGDVY